MSYWQFEQKKNTLMLQVFKTFSFTTLTTIRASFHNFLINNFNVIYADRIMQQVWL